MKRAVFLDRDGVLNLDLGYTYKVGDLKLVPGVSKALEKLQGAGYLFFIVTNQSGVARGLYTLDDVHSFNDALISKIKEEAPSVTFEEVLICPHHPDGTVSPYNVDCDCRKPRTLLVESMIKKHHIDRNVSWFIGDKVSDVECGLNAGLQSVQVTQGGKQYPHHKSLQSKFPTLAEAAEFILSAR